MLVTFTGWVPQFETYRIWGKFMGEHALWTDDPSSLVYNGNRHLARKPNTQELHLVYTDRGKVIYRYSSNGGTDWTSPTDIGEGKFPATILSSDYLPAVTWTDDEGGLWYRRKISATEWSETYHLYSPFPSPYIPHVNGPPSIAIVREGLVDFGHILVPLIKRPYPPINEEHLWSIVDCVFPLIDPYQVVFEAIEEFGLSPCSYPSIVKCDVDNSLHAVWQREDKMCYATRAIGQPWYNLGPQFGLEGMQSGHPFVETYGDSVFVLWHHQGNGPEASDVYRASAYIPFQPPDFSWFNLSQSPNTKSLYPVNASGMFNVYVDEIIPPPDSKFEIFCQYPGGLFNLSQTPTKSLYPHAVARVTGGWIYLYTTWLEGNDSPYEIRFKRLRFPSPQFATAFLTSPNGLETPSPYLIQRDSFISEWQIPVDIGYETITYKFPLEPGYRYKIKLIAYHESSGEWREWVKIDNKLKHLVKYKAYERETLELWVPPAYYQDGRIEVAFARISGAFATGGPIFVYRCEYEDEIFTGGSPDGMMAQENQLFSITSFAITPNPFTEKLNIKYQTPNGDKVSLKIYDVSGRLIKQFSRLTIQQSNQIVWHGDDENGRIVSQGVYFLRVENLDTGESSVHKILRIK